MIPTVTRLDNGIRDYSELDLKRVEFIKCMRSAGLPIEVLIEYVSLVQQGDSTAEVRKDILIEKRNTLEEHIKELLKTQDILDMKIKEYDRILLTKEEALSNDDEAERNI